MLAVRGGGTWTYFVDVEPLSGKGRSRPSISEHQGLGSVPTRSDCLPACLHAIMYAAAAAGTPPPSFSKAPINNGRGRELPDMMSVSEGEGGHEKWTY